MLIDRRQRIALFQVGIAASDDAAEVFLSRVAERLGMPAPAGDHGPLRGLRMSAGKFRDWSVDLELRTPAFPPAGPGWKVLALKGGDGVLVVSHRPSSGEAMDEVRRTLEELGYAWEPFPRVSYVLEGDGEVMEAIRAITARMIDSVKSNWPT